MFNFLIKDTKNNNMRVIHLNIKMVDPGNNGRRHSICNKPLLFNNKHFQTQCFECGSG